MDLQTATLGMMYWQTVASWVQAGILIITAGVIGWYTVETYRLRKEAQKQTELQLRPLVILKGSPPVQGRDSWIFQVGNVGNSTAMNVAVKEILVEPYKVVFRFSERVSALEKGQYATLRPTCWVGDKQ